MILPAAFAAHLSLPQNGGIGVNFLKDKGGGARLQARPVSLFKG